MLIGLTCVSRIEIDRLNSEKQRPARTGFGLSISQIRNVPGRRKNALQIKDQDAGYSIDFPTA